MPPAVAVCAYFGFIFLGGALLAPWLFKLVILGSDISPLFGHLSKYPFHRFVGRSFVLLGVIGLWPFLRSIGIRSWTEVGMGRPAGSRSRLLGLGFMIGFGSLLVTAALSMIAGARTLNTNQSLPATLVHVVNASLAGVVVAILEELFFRGAIFGALRKSFDWRFALLISTGVYAMVHFFQRPVIPEAVTWATGLASLGQMLRGFVDISHLIPAFFALLLVGWILGVAYHRTGSLYLSIGLHAGWIFWLKSYGFLTQERSGANQLFWGTSKLIDGWLALFVLAIVLAGVQRWLEPKQDAPAPAG